MEEELARAGREVDDWDDEMDARDRDTRWAEHLDAVRRVGAPWFDDVTGHLLDTKEVEAAMDKERESLRSFKFAELKDTRQMNMSKTVVIGTPWVVRLKPTATNSQSVKARLVAQQLNTGHWTHAFAAAPTPTGLRLVMLCALKHDLLLYTLDVSTAFLHAAWPKGEGYDEGLLRPPATEKLDEWLMWRPLRALYGLRASPRLWEKHMAAVFAGHHIERAKSDPQMYFDPRDATEMMMSVHTDDILLAVHPRVQRRILKLLHELVAVKPEATLGRVILVAFGDEFRRRRCRFVSRRVTTS